MASSKILSKQRASNEAKLQWVKQNTQWYTKDKDSTWLEFDRVYFISMPERLAYVNQIALTLNINSPWILKAFNKKHLNLSHLHQLELINGDFLNRRYKDRFAGELGCAISHIAVALHCMQDPTVNTCVIFEDDAKLNGEDSIERINSFLKQVRHSKLKWDILYLGYGAEPMGNFGSKEYIKLKNPTGLYAYVLNKKSIEKFLIDIFPLNMPIDNTYAKRITQKNVLALGPRYERFFSVEIAMGSNIRDTVLLYDQYLLNPP